MHQRHLPLIERMARAICQAHGNPVATIFEGKPMWHSYRREAKAALDGSGVEQLVETVRQVSKAHELPSKVRKELADVLYSFEHGAKRKAQTKTKTKTDGTAPHV